MQGHDFQPPSYRLWQMLQVRRKFTHAAGIPREEQGPRDAVGREPEPLPCGAWLGLVGAHAFT